MKCCGPDFRGMSDCYLMLPVRLSTARSHQRFRLVLQGTATAVAILLLTACGDKLKKLAGVRRWSLWRLAPAPIAFLLIAGCGDKPPIVSADTSCERFAHISATDAQIKVFQDNWDVMETYADQVVEFNISYDRACLGPVKP